MTQPVLVGAAGANSIFGASLTISVNNSGAGANRFIIGKVDSDRGAINTYCTAIRWNTAGQNLSLTNRRSDPVVTGASWWDALAPDAVNSSAVFTLASAARVTVIAELWDTVDQTTPLSDGALVENGAAVTSSSGNVANVTADDLAVDFLAQNTPAQDHTAGGSQTEMADIFVAIPCASSSHKSGTGTVNLTWSWSSGAAYSWFGYRLHGVAAGGGGVGPLSNGGALTHGALLRGGRLAA